MSREGAGKGRVVVVAQTVHSAGRRVGGSAERAEEGWERGERGWMFRKAEPQFEAFKK